MLSISQNRRAINSRHLHKVAQNIIGYGRRRNELTITGSHSYHLMCRNRINESSEMNRVFSVLNRYMPAMFQQYPNMCSNFHTTSMVYCKKDENSQNSNKSENERQNENKNEENEKNDDDKEDENKDKIKSILINISLWAALTYSIYSLVKFLLRTVTVDGKVPVNEHDNLLVSWQEFVYNMLSAGEVEEVIIRPELNAATIVLHEGAVVKGRRTLSRKYHILLSDALKFEEKIREVEEKLNMVEHVSVSYNRSYSYIGTIITAVIVVCILLSISSRVKVQVNVQSPFNKFSRAKYTLINPSDGGKGVYFKDVAGLKEAKQEVMEFVDYLKNPVKYQTLGAKVPKGALLLGPPGCGKTMLAKAVATESKVPFLSMNGSEFIEMIGGLGAARVRDLFKDASKKAPCIIYIDEIDAIGRKRSGSSAEQSSGEEEQTLNQLLVEMDGMASTQGVLMLASTNREDILDKALLRPGRFDRHILIDLPTLEERREIFERHLSSIVLECEPSKYSNRLAILTPRFSGADIANVCNEAALHAARSLQKKVRREDLEYAVERVVGGTEKRSHALSQEERRIVAFHESGHAIVGWLLENSDVLQKVTIVPRTNLALGFAQYTPADQKLFTKEQILDKMSMALGGRAAENITFSRITTGAQNDLEKVTKMAYMAISKYGMNSNLGPICVPDSKRAYSNAMAQLIDDEARTMVAQSYLSTEQLLRDNVDKLTKLAEALLQRETLNYDDVVELIGEPKFSAAKRKVDPAEFEESIKKLSADDTKAV